MGGSFPSSLILSLVCLVRGVAVEKLFSNLLGIWHNEEAWLGGIAITHLALGADDIIVMRCTIWYHLNNLKNVKSLQAKACKFTKSNTLPWVFFTFSKLYKWYQIVQNISNKFNLEVNLHIVWQFQLVPLF